MSGARYATGRNVLGAAAAWCAALTVSYALWRHQVILEVIAGAGVREAAVTELATLFGACLAAAALSSGMPWIDRVASRPFGRHAFGWGLALVAAFAAIPVVPLLVMHVAPGLLPAGTPVDISFDERPPLEVYSPLVGALVTATVAYSGLALLGVALLGRLAGPATAAATGFAIMVLQTGERSSLPLWGGAGDPPYRTHLDGVLAAAVLLVAGLAIWARTRGASGGELDRWRTRLGAMDSREGETRQG